ncbi:MAG: tetratricopeptide repeat protein [Cyanobacteriota bacterium]|nr:tetratricopeptide repeat protein [Cyanobacteriota bacterium]
MGLGAVRKLQNQYLKSIELYQNSIDVFEKIAAKCDLAEAYYQLALTQQKMGNPESQTYFNKAIQLWTEIDAPKQIDRVRNSIERAIEQ